MVNINSRARRYYGAHNPFDQDVQKHEREYTREEIEKMPRELRRQYDLDFEIEISKSEFAVALNKLDGLIGAYEDGISSAAVFMQKFENATDELNERYCNVVVALRARNNRDHGEGWIEKPLQGRLFAGGKDE